METLKKIIADLQAAVQAAKDKQKVAKEECKKLEKDMDEFKNNKDGKINELKVRLAIFVLFFGRALKIIFFQPRRIFPSKKPLCRNTL